LRKPFINRRNLLDPFRLKNNRSYIPYPVKTEKPNATNRQQQQQQPQQQVQQEQPANETEVPTDISADPTPHNIFDDYSLKELQIESPVQSPIMSRVQVGLIELKQSAGNPSLLLPNRAILMEVQ